MAAKRVTIWNPVNGLPWDCPAGAVDFWVNEKGFHTEPPKPAAPAPAKSDKKGDA